MHPYQMQRLLHLRHKDDILALRRGSLYHAIRRLAANGLIDVENTGREGRRPERTTYRITPAGVTAFLDSLRKNVATTRREPSECMVAMSFLAHLDPAEASKLLAGRANRLALEIENFSARLTGVKAFVDRINLIESEYQLAMMKAERAWLQSLEEEIRSGSLTWDLDAILAAAAASREAAARNRESAARKKEKP